MKPLWYGILGIALNVIVLPGLGTFIHGYYLIGMLQAVLFICTMGVSAFYWFGWLFAMAVWIWALITGLSLIAYD